MRSIGVILSGITVAIAGFAAAQNTKTASADVAAAAATALTRSPTSNVQGKAFDRFVVIWNENTDYDKAIADPNLAWLAQKGITLSNHFALTHPSEPNYVSAIGGDYWGMNNDNFNQVPSNISSVIDLLEDKGISWGAYQEDMPYSGFEGMAYVNQQTGANDYVRKHNPPVIYDSVATSRDRLACIKNLTLFQQDLEANRLPQWMFITPNMTSDGHDTSVTVAGQWTRNFLEPLLADDRFMNNTLVLITFDENETYEKQNRVLAILLGDAVPSTLVNTTDAAFYNHYSEIATVEANWGLHTLGRWDVGANVYSFVAAATGDAVRDWSGAVPLSDMYFNYSLPGPFNSEPTPGWKVPNVTAVWNGRTVLDKVKQAWGNVTGAGYYTTSLEVPDGYRQDVGVAAESGKATSTTNGTTAANATATTTNVSTSAGPISSGARVVPCAVAALLVLAVAAGWV